jgi:hypothetical protein
MTAQAARRQDSLAPALLAALALHLALFVALTILRPSLPMSLGSAVPINIVSSEPAAEPRQATQAPQTQMAQVDQPVPQAPAPTPPPPPAAPAPSPRVAPVAPSLKPTLRPTPTPAKPTPAPRDDSDFLNSLAATVKRYTRAQPPQPAFAARGPTRAATAPAAQEGAGQGVSQSDIEGLSQLLNRLWLKNCDAATPVDVTVRLVVDDDGRVASADAGGRQNASDPAVSASAIRAIAAVHQGAPYAEEFRGKRFTINFDASKACSSR